MCTTHCNYYCTFEVVMKVKQHFKMFNNFNVIWKKSVIYVCDKNTE